VVAQLFLDSNSAKQAAVECSKEQRKSTAIKSPRSDARVGCGCGGDGRRIACQLCIFLNSNSSKQVAVEYSERQ
jgi:hypothetical protein